MSATLDRRGPDRRKVPRGGRRVEDLGAFSPLIVLVDGDDARRELCSVVLLQMRFAVAPFASADRALSVLRALSPDAIVVWGPELDMVTMSGDIPRRNGRTIPIVPLTVRSEVLIGALRTAFRAPEES